MPANVLADISDPASKVPIQIDEGDFETLCQKSTDRALAGSARADQSESPRGYSCDPHDIRRRQYQIGETSSS